MSTGYFHSAEDLARSERVLRRGVDNASWEPNGLALIVDALYSIDSHISNIAAASDARDAVDRATARHLRVPGATLDEARTAALTEVYGDALDTKATDGEVAR